MNGFACENRPTLTLLVWLCGTAGTWSRSAEDVEQGTSLDRQVTAPDPAVALRSVAHCCTRPRPPHSHPRRSSSGALHLTLASNHTESWLPGRIGPQFRLVVGKVG